MTTILWLVAGLAWATSSLLSAGRLAAPTVDAPTAAGVESQRAWLGGTVTADGGATITERGIVYSESTVNAAPVIGGTGVVKVVTRGTTGTFTALVQGLQSNTLYSYRPFATNADGTAYGPVATVRTLRERPLRLWALGDDQEGGTGLERKIRHWPVSPIAGAFVSVDSGTSFTVAVRADGTVWSWGHNFRGATAQGAVSSGTYTTVPTQVSGLTGVQSVSAGLLFAVALKADGTLWTWGYNLYGQLGQPSSVTSTGVPVRVGTASNWVQVSAGTEHVFAINALGELWAWGNGANLRLGTGTSTSVYQPVRIGTDADWALVTAGSSTPLAIKTDGSLWSWGNHSNGLTGVGLSSGTQALPTRVDLDTDWATVSAGANNVFAVKTDGTLWGWGDNTYGQLGLTVTGTTSIRVPTRIGGDANWQSVQAPIDANSRAAFGRKTDGSLWVWGQSGDALAGAVGYLPLAIAPTRIFADRTVQAFAARGDADMGALIRQDGTLEVWGSNSSVFRLGLGSLLSAVPSAVGDTAEWLSVANGELHSVGVKADGSLWQ